MGRIVPPPGLSYAPDTKYKISARICTGAQDIPAGTFLVKYVYQEHRRALDFIVPPPGSSYASDTKFEIATINTYWFSRYLRVNFSCVVYVSGAR